MYRGLCIFKELLNHPSAGLTLQFPEMMILPQKGLLYLPSNMSKIYWNIQIKIVNSVCFPELWKVTGGAHSVQCRDWTDHRAKIRSLLGDGWSP